MRSVGVRELRQNLSRYLDDVKRGESLVVTERGHEVARLIPTGSTHSALQRLVAERGATMPHGDLRTLDAPGGRPAVGPPSADVLAALREERL